MVRGRARGIPSAARPRRDPVDGDGDLDMCGREPLRRKQRAELGIEVQQRVPGSGRHWIRHKGSPKRMDSPNAEPSASRADSPRYFGALGDQRRLVERR